MLKKISSYAFVLLGLMILLNSCKKEYESIQNIDDTKIKDYLTNNNITNAVHDETGYYYQILTPGTGTENYKNSDSVLYNVTVKSLFDGTSFYASPVSANLGSKVGYMDTFLGLKNTSIRTALNALKPGGSFRVILPSYLAFGKNGSTSLKVPSNEVIEVTVSTFPELNQQALDDRRIKAFLKDKGLEGDPDPKGSGTYSVVSNAGTGEVTIELSSTIKAKYTGRLLDGTQFDASTDGTFSSALSSLVGGWRALIGLDLKTGAKVRLLIPSGSGYGTSAQGTIPANSCLDFDIEIVEITN